MARSLDQWLTYQQHTHKVDIAFGLDRSTEVWCRMGAPRAPLVITVGGTNGKGSTSAFLTAMLQAMGLRVGMFTSPHIRRYNERIAVGGEPVDDAVLCVSFERIEAARGEIPLTYYEFSTLAALDVFAHAGVDTMVLEVGMGGRLDATNIIDADAVAITGVDLDHVEWLGPDRDSIGHEQAGIARATCPAIVGDRQPPQGLLGALTAIGAREVLIGRDFDVTENGDERIWTAADGTSIALPPLALRAPCQSNNAATAVAVLHALRERLPWSPDAVVHGLASTRLRGRLEVLGEAPQRIVDVGHNPQAARILAQWLDANPVSGKTRAVFGVMRDKDVDGILVAIGERVDVWYVGGLDGELDRGMNRDDLARHVQRALPEAFFDTYADIPSAWRQALHDATTEDRVLAFGSFHVVDGVLGCDVETSEAAALVTGHA